MTGQLRFDPCCLVSDDVGLIPTDRYGSGVNVAVIIPARKLLELPSRLRQRESHVLVLPAPVANERTCVMTSNALSPEPAQRARLWLFGLAVTSIN